MQSIRWTIVVLVIAVLILYGAMIFLNPSFAHAQELGANGIDQLPLTGGPNMLIFASIGALGLGLLIGGIALGRIGK